MRVLVTGGCGFIGSHLVDLLLEKGHTVTVLDDFSTGRKRDPPPDCRLIKGSVVCRERVDRAVDGCQVVFHLAASVGNARSIARPLDDAVTNVLGTINVLEASRQAGVERVVYSSSAGIFGEMKHLPVREDHPCEPDSPYGCTKLCAEKQCLAHARLYGLSAVCLRYFNVYGPRQRYDAYGNVIPIFAEKMFNKMPLTIYGDGSQTRDFVNVRDVVQANFLAATVPGASGAYNIGSGKATSINDLVRMLDYGDLIYRESRPGDVSDSVSDISRAEQELGYAPSVELPDGLREYLAWFRQERSLG